MRSSRQLLLSTLPFARESRAQSWWHLGTTLVVLAALSCLTLWDGPWYFRLPASFLMGLTLVRFFVLYHDHQHGNILIKSRLANLVMSGFGLLFLNPPSVWKRSHNHHHMHNCRAPGINVGSFPLMTLEDYREASSGDRWKYALQRHPLTIALGYLTVFFLGMCVVPLVASPRRHLDALFSIICHSSLLMWVGLDGWDDVWLVVVIPSAIGSALGAYLFYAQHNFPAARLRMGPEWSMVSAALNSSSYMRMNPVLRWFTGNIGYHHVHHLNAHIPFYRLPEAMAAIEELQSPGTTSLRFNDVRACLQLKLWDAVQDKLVPFPDQRQAG